MIGLKVTDDINVTSSKNEIVLVSSLVRKYEIWAYNKWIMLHIHEIGKNDQMICEEIQFLASRVIGLKINIGGEGGGWPSTKNIRA